LIPVLDRYKVRSTFGANTIVEAYRRHSDFELLCKEICTSFPGIIIPTLPDNKADRRSPPSAAVVEDRRQQFERFLKHLITKHNTAHDNFAGFNTIRLFLCDVDSDENLKDLLCKLTKCNSEPVDETPSELVCCSKPDELCAFLSLFVV
jgi:hypothetical protein